MICVDLSFVQVLEKYDTVRRESDSTSKDESETTHSIPVSVSLERK